VSELVLLSIYETTGNTFFMSSARELMQSKALLGGAFGRPTEETLHNYWAGIIALMPTLS